MQQHDLFGGHPPVIVPDLGRPEPRLWVRRLVVWEDRGRKIRDVPLRPGLNVVWSPDEGGSVGHGSGKTLFCRLLRYCLGEDRFAPEDQRTRIGAALINGMVGAEVVVDGVVWAVLRPLGVKRRQMAVAEGKLDAIADGEGTSTGLKPFLDALTASFLPADIAGLVPGHAEDGKGWLAALAWATRDQECRLGDVLGWRDPASGSDSPVSGWGAPLRADAIRAFLRAITAEEQALRLDHVRLKREQDTAAQRAERLEWQFQDLFNRLRRDLDMPSFAGDVGGLEVEAIQDAARRKFETIARLPAGTARQDLDGARKDLDVWGKKVKESAAAASAAAATLVATERMIPMIRAEVQNLSFDEISKSNVLCKVCRVPISEALATKCGLSEVFHDLEEVRAYHESRRSDLKQEEDRLEGCRREKERLAGELATAESHLRIAKERFDALDRVERSRNGEWYAAHRLVDEANRLAQLRLDAEEVRRRQEKAQKDLSLISGRAEAFREIQERAQQRLVEIFDGIVRSLLSPDASGSVGFHAKTIALKVKYDGDRSTAAIESLKVIAFDLAALCLSIEGRSAMPPFLVHDSPREADLAQSIYDRVFQFARSLEPETGTPQFQYILTTTTAPPEQFRGHPWMRLELRGTPADGRLLGRDL